MNELVEWVEQVVVGIVGTVESTGYLGIFLLMLVESSFVPFPSEIVMIPAGYLAGTGRMELGPAIAAGLAGSIVGAWINYGLACWLGRPFLLRYGKYFLLPESKMRRADLFFARHGEITTLVGRLIPVIRQLISIPAGVARMNALRFTVFTGLGAGTWVATLALCGFWAGRQHHALKHVWQQHGPKLTLMSLAAAVLLTAGYTCYWLWRRRIRPPSHESAAEPRRPTAVS